LAPSTADAIGLRHLFDQHHHMSGLSVVLACQDGTQPITYFLADSSTTIAVDLNIIPNSRTGHESFLVCLAAVSTDKTRLKLRAITTPARGT
jgi:hypothetical protein